MDLRSLTLAQLDGLIDAAQVELRARRRPADDVRLMLQAAVAMAGYEWGEVFPGCEAPWNPPPDAAPPREDAGDAGRLLAAWPVTSAGALVSLSRIQEALGMQQDWPAFYSLLEEAIRSGWVYFRGRDHVCLTETGQGMANALRKN